VVIHEPRAKFLDDFDRVLRAEAPRSYLRSTNHRRLVTIVWLGASDQNLDQHVTRRIPSFVQGKVCVRSVVVAAWLTTLLTTIADDN
jgi:hypothetical protein